MSMNRIEGCFEKNGKKLSVFLTAGYPRLDDTIPLCIALEKSGADMIEIGIPFADPIADGPTIQDSSVQALKNGMSLEYLFQSLSTLREQVSIPILLMGYLNPIMQYGIERFAQDAAKAGIDGVIIPDLPVRDFEAQYRVIFSTHGIRTVFLVTSRTSQERIRLLDSAADAFLYVVASETVTGAKAGLSESTKQFLARLSEMNLRNRTLVGFGIHDKATFNEAIERVDGAIVGSAFVRTLGKLTSKTGNSKLSDNGTLESCVKEFISSLKGYV